MKNKHDSQNIETPKTHEEPQHEFAIQRIYLKDLSYEAPNTPEIFKNEWIPKIDLNLNIDSKKLADDIYEVILQVTVTAKLNDKTAFLIEVKKAGIFLLKGFSKEQLELMLASFCPNVLFPYARELISATIARGSFAPLYLAPINFDAMYQEQLKNHGKEKHH